MFSLAIFDIRHFLYTLPLFIVLGLTIGFVHFLHLYNRQIQVHKTNINQSIIKCLYCFFIKFKHTLISNKGLLNLRNNFV